MNKIQPETRERTKQNIKDAFWALYKEKKIEKITIKDVTIKAGYNRSTFYAYFTDVYDVLEQIEDDVMPGLEHLPPTDKELQNSSDFFSNVMHIYQQYSDYYSVLLSEKGDPSFAVRMKNVFKKMMKQNMEDIMEDHPSISETEVDYALEFFIGGTISIIKHWYDTNKTIEADQLMPLMHQLMSNAFVQRLHINE